MKRRFLYFFAVLLGMLALVTGCGESENAHSSQTISVPEDLNKAGYIIGVPQGAAAMTAGERFFDKAKIQYYNSLAAGYTAVQQKKIDAFIFDRHSMEYVVKVNPALALLPVDIAEEHIVIGLPSKHGELVKEVNRFIAQYRTDGTYQDMYKRWFSADPPPMPEIPAPKNPSRKLRVGTEGLNEPMNFYGKDGQLTGFDLEFIKRLALFLNAELEVSAMTYDGLIPAAETGKIDLLIANLNYSEERKEKMLMSDDYVDSAICVMIHKDRLPGAAKASDVITTVKDLAGKRAAYLNGTIFAQLTEPLVDNVEYLSFNDNNSSVQALRSGKADAVLLDEPVARLFAAQFPDELQVACIYAKDSYGFAFRKGSPLTAKASAVIRELKRTGELDAMTAKWCGADASKKTLGGWTHRKDFSGRNGTLRFAAEPVLEPMCYAGANGEYIGLDIEIMRRIAYELDMKFEFIPMNFGGLIEALIAGKSDVVGGSMSITEERKEKVDFSESYYLGGMTILAKKSKAARNADVITAVGDLAGKRVAYLTGSCYRQLTEELVKDVNYLSFSDHNSGVQALRSNKADAVLVNEPVGKLFVARFPDELRIACSFSEDLYGIAFRKGSPLTVKASGVIRRLKESGELAELSAKWCGADYAKKVISPLTYKTDFTGRNGTLKFAAEPTMEPMCYAGPNGQYLGLDVEIMQRIAYELDMKLEFIPMNFGGLIEALMSGKADAVGGAMSITRERREKVDFAESHYAGRVTVLGRKAPESPAAITAFSQLYGKRIGVLSGTTMDRMAQEHFPSSKPVYFNSFADLPIALESGKIEAFLIEEPQARLLVKQRPKLHMLPKKLSSDEYAFLFSLQEEELCNAFSEQIRKMRTDGTLAELDKKWFSGDESRQVMPPPPSGAPKGVLKYATVPQLEPFTFLRNGQVVGYDIEVAQRIAEKLGYALEPVIMDWGGYLDAIASGKVRFGVGCTTVTEERKQKVLFSESNYKGGVAVIVGKAPETGTGTDAKEWFVRTGKELATSFDRTFVREDRWKLILDGLKVTVLITVLAAALGTVLAFGVCAMRRSKNRFLSLLAQGYIALMQGMPILVILMILYYVIFAKIDIDAIIVAVIGFALNFAAYAGEMFRSGINSIPKGQAEAALALGFSKSAAFRKVILPQVLRRILPIYRGEFVSMLKMTSIVGYIAIQDLTKMSDIIRSRTYEAFFPLIATAIIYFAAAHLLASVLTYLEFRLDPLNRRSAAKGGKN